MFYGYNDYMVVIDAYIKWLEIRKLRSKRSSDIISVLKEFFCSQVIPDIFCSDNMAFNSIEFLGFASEWQFRTITSSPTYLQSNGLAEKTVGIAKSIFRKSEDLYAGLLEYRNSPIVSIGLSPSQLLNNRRLRDKLTVYSGLFKQAGINTEEVRRKLIKNQHVQKCFYDKKGVDNLPKVKEGDKIVIRKDGIWDPGTVIGEHQSPRSYIVEDDSGKIIRINRKLLETLSSDYSKPSDESSEGSGRSEGRVSRTIREPVRFDDYILS
ncbi:hypothetical protein JTB14_007466 [Gonioctena quinquepunctata]|nr:hypothetical protein JTB14_007466 [Gonioctena quinquepunctata]